MATQLTDNNFEQEVIKSDKVVMVDFWAEWCGPCRMIGPVVEELGREYDGKAIVAKMNVDENSQIPSQFGIRSIPTILFFKGGKLVDKQIGVVPKSILEQKLKSHMDS